MDHSHFQSRLLGFAAISERIPALSSKFAARARHAFGLHSLGFKELKGLKGLKVRHFLTTGLAQVIFLTLSAVGLAAFAYQSTQADAVLRWKRDHPPELSLWRTVLRAQGFMPVTDPEFLQAALRHLPLQVDSENHLWKSANGAWLALFSPEATDSLPTIYRLSRPTPATKSSLPQRPDDWQFLGSSWDALSRWTTDRQKTEAPGHPLETRPSAFQLPARPYPRDTRALRY